MRQGCIMSLWLPLIFTDGCMMKIKPKVRKVGARLMNLIGWAKVVCMFADDIVVCRVKGNFRAWYMNFR